jgi:hypothetical protein
VAIMGLIVLWPFDAARADCTPAAANNVTATCSGTTINQGAGAPGTSAGNSGYGTGAQNNVNVTVQQGASVTGTTMGVLLGPGSTVVNSGSVGGGTGPGIQLNAGGAGTVINYGSVSSASDHGIFFFDDGAVTNFGSIAGGSAGNGVAFIGVGMVTNFGSISGNDKGVSFDSGTVSNWGSISGTSAAVAGYGVFVTGSTVDVNNWGTISGGSPASLGYGINAAGAANVNNWGTISGTGGPGGGGWGISALNANVTNWGTISATSGGGARGIVASNATVFNCGTISGTSAVVGYGIEVSGTANVTNCGTISGNTAALNFSGSADTLTLLPGSKIIGAINLGGGGDTVNFRGGNHNLTFDTLAGATVTGTTPFVVAGNQAVAVDPTPFAVNGRALGDFSRSVSSVVPNFGNQPAATGSTPTAFATAPPSSAASVVSAAFDGIPGLSAQASSAYAADQAVFKAPTVVQSDGTVVWARGFGGYRVQQSDGVLLHSSTSFFGGAIGVEKQVQRELRIGAFAGAGATRSSLEANAGDTDSNLGFGGLYARRIFGASFLYAGVQAGGSRNDTTRNINNNLAAGGIETAKGSYTGWYISPELTYGHRLALGQAFGGQYTLTPSLQLRYLYGSFGRYTETGSTANLTVNTQTVQTLEERAELKLTRAMVLNPYSALLIELTGGVLGVQRVGSNTVNAALLGQSIPFATPGDDNVWGGFGGLGIEYRNANVAVFASGEYLALSDSSSVASGKGGVRVAF